MECVRGGTGVGSEARKGHDTVPEWGDLPGQLRRRSGGGSGQVLHEAGTGCAWALDQ